MYTLALELCPKRGEGCRNHLSPHLIPPRSSSGVGGGQISLRFCSALILDTKQHAYQVIWHCNKTRLLPLLGSTQTLPGPLQWPQRTNLVFRRMAADDLAYRLICHGWFPSEFTAGAAMTFPLGLYRDVGARTWKLRHECRDGNTGVWKDRDWRSGRERGHRRTG